MFISHGHFLVHLIDLDLDYEYLWQITWTWSRYLWQRKRSIWSRYSDRSSSHVGLKTRYRRVASRPFDGLFTTRTTAIWKSRKIKWWDEKLRSDGSAHLKHQHESYVTSVVHVQQSTWALVAVKHTMKHIPSTVILWTKHFEWSIWMTFRYLTSESSTNLIIIRLFPFPSMALMTSNESSNDAYERISFDRSGTQIGVPLPSIRTSCAVSCSENEIQNINRSTTEKVSFIHIYGKTAVRSATSIRAENQRWFMVNMIVERWIVWATAVYEKKKRRKVRSIRFYSVVHQLRGFHKKMLQHIISNLKHSGLSLA